ncbi:MAG: hypothetical protein ACXVLQ_02185 [Bacteriovorax sp.]
MQELNLKDMKGFVLSPGNVFWKQKSGAEVLISAKADFLNLELIEKLSAANQNLIVSEQVDLHLQNEFIELFKAHEKELLVKEKNKWRLKLLSLFSGILSKEGLSQFELNMAAWRVFSKIERSEALIFLERDIDIFKRSVSIATSYALGAFLLGHYSDSFLQKIFNETFLGLVNLNPIVPVQKLKEDLERMRAESSFTEGDKSYLKSFNQDKKQSLLFAEKYDGSGLQQINKNEMTDLELLLVALCSHYSFKDHDNKTIFNEIKKSQFNCEGKIAALLRRGLEIHTAKSMDLSA